MKRGRLRKELLEGSPLIELPLQSGLVIAREPADDLVHLGFHAVLLLCLLHVVRIHSGKGAGENPMSGHGGDSVCQVSVELTGVYGHLDRLSFSGSRRRRETGSMTTGWRAALPHARQSPPSVARARVPTR